MSAPFCSTGVLDSIFAPLYSTAGGNLRLAVVSSSDLVPTIAGCSSDHCLVFASITTGYFTIANSGDNRVCTISACSCDDVIATGTASYVCIFEDASAMRLATVVTTQALTTGNKVNIGSWTITVAQPVT